MDGPPLGLVTVFSFLNLIKTAIFQSIGGDESMAIVILASKRKLGPLFSLSLVNFCELT